MRAASHHGGGFSFDEFPPLPSPKPPQHATKQNSDPTTSKFEPIKHTYAETIRSKPFTSTASLPKLQNVNIRPPTITTKEGVKAIIFQEEEIEASKKVFEFALVARFYGERPSVDEFDFFVNSKWDLDGLAVVGLLDPRHILLRMENETDFIKAWTREDCFFNQARYVLFKWTPSFNSEQEMKRAVWVELQKLPLYFQLPAFLEEIGNNIGKFLKTDERTKAGKHPIAPRMCIELDLLQPLPQSVWVGFSSKNGHHFGFHQVITYDFNKAKCLHCKQLGHESVLCPQRAKHHLLFKKRPTIHSANEPSSSAISKRAWVIKGSKIPSKIHSKEPQNSLTKTGFQDSKEPCISNPPCIPCTIVQGDNLENTPKKTQSDFNRNVAKDTPRDPPLDNFAIIPSFAKTVSPYTSWNKDGNFEKVSNIPIPCEPAPSPHFFKFPFKCVVENISFVNSKTHPLDKSTQFGKEPFILSTPVSKENNFDYTSGEVVPQTSLSFQSSGDKEPLKFSAPCHFPIVSTVLYNNHIANPILNPATLQKTSNTIPPCPPCAIALGDHMSGDHNAIVVYSADTFHNEQDLAPTLLAGPSSTFLSPPMKVDTLNPKAIPYHSSKARPPFFHANTFDALLECNALDIVPLTGNPYNPETFEPLQVIPSGPEHKAKFYRPIFHSSGLGDTSWHNERRNYSKDKITLSSLFKAEEESPTSAQKPKLEKAHKKIIKRVSWIEGDILSTHNCEHEFKPNIEESLLSPRDKPTIKVFKYSKAYRMEGAKHVAWASKYFRDRVNFIDEMDKRQLDYWEENYV